MTAVRIKAAHRGSVKAVFLEFHELVAEERERMLDYLKLQHPELSEGQIERLWRELEEPDSVR